MRNKSTPLLLPYPTISNATASFVVVLVTALFLLFLYLTTSLPSKPTYHSLFLSLSSNSTAADHLRALTRVPHVAGSAANSDAAAYVVSVLSSLSFPTHSSYYSVLLSYPIHRSLSLTSNPNPTIYFNLAQETYPGDPYADAAADVIPTFHAYAASGAVTAPVAYANYGRVEDFEALRTLGVNLTGTVILARYGKIYRGDIVRNAQDAGAAAAVVYTDSKDYGGGGRNFFPQGPWMPPSGVQIGSTYRGLGDPTTPGWACSVGDGAACERLSKADVAASGLVPGIPSLPVSAKDGEAIHQTIGGHAAPDDWQGGDGEPVYRLGPGPGIINLTYSGNETTVTIQNVFAVIEGKEEPDRYVLLGNHRDAWTFGAVDPNSGTAALLEVAQRLWKLQKRGWRPRRTIVLCNWDAEEYGLIGSTEWVEDNREMLASRAVAYLNVDSAVTGHGFWAAATPQLDEMLKEASKDVQDPDNSSRTLYESWIASGDSLLIGRLGGGGTDFAAFVQHVGVPSIDMSFGEGYPVYHSLYDDFMWMEKFGDPMFHRHVAAASIWGLIALKLADEEILPFDYTSYALELKRSAKIIKDEALGMRVSFSPLYKSIKELKRAATKVDGERKALKSKLWGLKLRNDPLKVRELNDRLMMTERAFTDREGLFEREWYKHLIYGPSQHDDYGSKAYPGIDDAIEKAISLNTSESRFLLQHEVWRAARAVSQAARVLSGKLT
ncbi:probable glutamate carboxypeptidase LAMP1 [Typha angustifolia]|uniref:probable glutamate carboxypeptidase LAMP1 n=1 Tax=Typha angustifolia TaxID=59011 RepID=UPI003C30E1E7